MAVKKSKELDGDFVGNGIRAPAELSVSRNGGIQPIHLTITGITPLLINALSADTLLGLAGLMPKRSKTAEKGDPREVANSKLHLGPDGKACIPVQMIWKTLILAGQFVRMDGKRQVSNATKTNLSQLITLVSRFHPLRKSGTEEPATWEVDIMPGTNPNGGEKVAVIRPRFDSWEISFIVDVNRKRFSVAQTRELVDIAGRGMGFGDFRPNRMGMYGQFVVTKWEPKLPVSPDANLGAS